MRNGRERLPVHHGLRAEITLNPIGSREQVRLSPERLVDGPALRIGDLPKSFTDRFAAASSIIVTTDGRRLLDMRLPAADRAVATLRACNVNLVRSWGIDAEALRRLKQYPEIVSGTAYSGDYPLYARRRSMQGVAVMRVTVGIDGRASTCSIAVSSGHQILDDQSCSLVRERFRFTPALDESGRLVPATIPFSTEWVL
jgi:TonB family protein